MAIAQRSAVGKVLAFGLVSAISFCVAWAADRQAVVSGLENPESVVIGSDGKIYVTVQGKTNADGDGSVIVVEDGKPRKVAQALDNPKGIDKRGAELFVADQVRVRRIDAAGDATVYVDTAEFPITPRLLNDLTVGPNGDIFVSDLMAGAVFKISPDKVVTAVVDGKSSPAVRPNGVLSDGPDNLFVLDFGSGKLFRLKLANRSLTELASGLGSPDGIVRDAKGHIYVCDIRGGRILKIELPAGTDKAAPTVVAEGLQSPADIALDAAGKLLIPEGRKGEVSSMPLE